MKDYRCMVVVAIIAASSLAGAGILPHSGGSPACGATKDSVTTQHSLQSKTSTPQIPGFAVRSKIPAGDKQGPAGKAAAMIGNWQKGERLFVKNCQSCHGPHGTDDIPNPGSSDGTVPPLNPIDPELADKNPSLFAAHIDRFIQHGSIPDGSDPALFMPNWEDSQLSQRDIADLEAYIMHLNGVAREKL